MPNLQDSGALAKSISITLPDGSLLRWSPWIRIAAIRGRKLSDVRTFYRVQEVPAVNGRGFRFTKADGAIYAVTIANLQETLDHDCNCKGFQNRGHCRHVDAAVAISERTE